ncbi:MAG: hypothetical protein HYV76_00695 [Candidatus Vogelbacteria bacterium]|nr:hypothetical protein [Candidatus Vogelbacteria bacterium]
MKQKIILLLHAGIALSLTRTAKKQIYLLKTTHRKWQKIEKRKLYRLIREFHHERLVDWREYNDGSISITLSQAGKKLAQKFDFDNMTLPQSGRWDRKWRVVMYDIPQPKQATRDALRSKLKELGFKEFQKSVFIYPYSCCDEINFIIEFFDIRPYVTFGELVNPTNEASLKMSFGVK